MNIYLDCVPCFIRQALDAARLATDDEKIHEQVVRDALRLALNTDMSLSPPALAQQIHRHIRGIIGSDDPYFKMKQRFNRLAMEIFSGLESDIAASANPLETAIRLAIAGNIIDCGVKSSIPEHEIESVINESLAADFEAGELADFRRAVDRAGSILYLTDNAGEIVFDKLLIEQLPMERVTVAVRGYPVINDATMEDAEFAGLTSMVKVIDNGSDAPATILDTCSNEFLDCFNAASLVIAKGQGNYESLSNVDKDIFFILKVKCPVIAKDIGRDVGKMILRRSTRP
jgi:damage-control phosphatase, subfamily I